MSVHCDKCGQAKWLSKVFPKVEADLKTAQEMIKDFREVLEFYGDRDNWTTVDEKTFSSIREKNFPVGDSDATFEPRYAGYKGGKRARDVLQKWKGKLNENT